MARSTREGTREHIEAAATADPLALGPLIGRFAMTLGISMPLMASMLGAHEETVQRWVRGRSEIAATWMPKIAKLLTFFAWMRSVDWEPLHGTVEERKRQLATAGKVFAEVAGVKPKRKSKD